MKDENFVNEKQCTECLHYISLWKDIDRGITRPSCSIKPGMFVSHNPAKTCCFWVKKEI